MAIWLAGAPLAIFCANGNKICTERSVLVSALLNPRPFALMKTYPLLTLIADDCEDDRVLFSRAVRSLPGLCLAGMTTDGVDTMAYLNGCAPYGNRLKFPYPDLILLDCQMPGYNGLEVLASMTAETPRPKVVLWSGTIETIDQRLAYELGATIVCSKPVIPEDVEDILRSVQPCISNRNRAPVLVPPRRPCRFLSQPADSYLRKVLQPAAAS